MAKSIEIADYRGATVKVEVSGSNLISTDLAKPANTQSVPLPASLTPANTEIDIAKQGGTWHIILSDGAVIRYGRSAADVFGLDDINWINTKG